MSIFNVREVKHSRREFLKKAAVSAAGISIIPNITVSGLGHRPPSDKLNIVGIGIGGKGHPNLIGMNTESAPPGRNGRI